MSTTIAFNRRGRGFFPQPRPGSSEEAKRLEENYFELSRHIQESIVLGQNRRLSLDSLIELYRDAASPNWNGYGAEGVSFEAYCKADSLLRLLPSGLPIPDLSAHPDGEIAFEWRVPPRKILTISVGSRNAMTYACIFGSEEHHGVVDFTDDIPSKILELLGELTAA